MQRVRVKGFTRQGAAVSQTFLLLHLALVDAKKDPNALKRRIEMLSHHVCDEHEWEGGGCDFHSLVQCNCGKCTDGNSNGKKYKTRYKLKCQYHWLTKLNCIIEVNRQNGLFPRNSVEATQIRLRKKSWNIQRVHYHTSTNLGLLESNLTFMHSIRGIQYHWLPELYAEFELPDVDGVKAFYKVKNRAREARRQKRQTTEYKKKASESKHRHRAARAARIWQSQEAEPYLQV